MQNYRRTLRRATILGDVEKFWDTLDKLHSVRFGADLSVKSIESFTERPFGSELNAELFLNVALGHVKLVQLLLSVGNVHANTIHEGVPILVQAARHGREKIVNLLLETFHSVVIMNKRDSGNRSPLWWAAERGHLGVVRILMTYDILKCNEVDSMFQQTPICRAAAKGYYEITKMLLQSDRVDPNFKTTCGMSPLLAATAGGHERVVKLLLDSKRVQVDLGDRFRRTALGKACASGNIEIAELLARAGADSDAADTQMTPLLRAAHARHYDIVHMLLALGKPSDANRSKLFITAARHNEPGVIRQLLSQSGKSIDKVVKEKALLQAAKSGFHAIVYSLLADADVDLSCTDANGHTPKALAEKQDHWDIARILQDSMGT